MATDDEFDAIVAPLKPKRLWEKIAMVVTAVIMGVVMLVGFLAVLTFVAWATMECVMFIVHFWRNL